MMGALQMGAVLVGILSMLVLIIWERPFMKKMSWNKLVPGPWCCTRGYFCAPDPS